MEFEETPEVDAWAKRQKEEGMNIFALLFVAAAVVLASSYAEHFFMSITK